ncbi:MAG: porin family protein [Flavobacteriaceae bacterium]|nr:porin family protein [Flavobacteriaceae bacterium]
MIKYQKNILSIVLVFFAFTVNAQNFSKGSITLNNNEVINGKLSILSDSQSAEIKKNNKTLNYSFNQIQSLTTNDRLFVKKTFDDNSFLAHELVAGKASLFQIEKNRYLISKEDGVFKMIDSKNGGYIERGLLNVLFEDCNSIRESIKKAPSLSESALIDLVNSYNTCSYGEFSPSEKELNKANTFNTDEYKFFIGAGIGIRSVSFFDNNSTENLNQFGFKIGVATTPSFIGKLQGNLYFNMEASYHFGSETDFTNSISPTSFSVNTFRLVFSSDYYFNKKGALKPFIGVGIGLTAENFEGNVSGNEFDINSGNPIWMPKAGLMYTFKNGKDISLTFNYIPEYDNDLSFPIGEDEVIPLKVNSSYINFGLNYYF